jgi:hypothetical protein
MPCVDIYLSAKTKGSISIRTIKRTFLAVVVAAVALAFVGCGSDDTPDAPQATAPTTPATGATEAVTPTGDTGATANSEPTEAAANPNDPGAGDEEAVRSVVNIGLKGGNFTRGTTRKVHVPPFIGIEIDAKVDDDGPYNLVITGGDGKQRLVTYKKPGNYQLRVDALKTRQSATIVLGGDQQIKITADAEPGP